VPYTLDIKKKPAPPVVKKKGGFLFQNKPVKGVTLSYERALRAVAKQIGRLIEPYKPEENLDPMSMQSLIQILKGYSELLGPWALNLCNNVFRSVDNADRSAWREHSKNMSVALRKELDNAPIGDKLKEIMQQNVLLIKSIPLQAAERVHGLIQENMMQSRRADEVAQMIMDTENVTKNRATLIARTEISRSSVVLTQARASYIGANSYIWHTSGDLIVRKSHREVNGKVFDWDSPPTLSDGTTTHPGCIYNCRCWPEPIIPDAG